MPLHLLSTWRKPALPGCSGVAIATSIEYSEGTWFAWLKKVLLHILNVGRRCGLSG